MLGPVIVSHHASLSPLSPSLSLYSIYLSIFLCQFLTLLFRYLCSYLTVCLSIFPFSSPCHFFFISSFRFVYLNHLCIVLYIYHNTIFLDWFYAHSQFIFTRYFPRLLPHFHPVLFAFSPRAVSPSPLLLPHPRPRSLASPPPLPCGNKDASIEGACKHQDPLTWPDRALPVSRP